jgi:tripartite-type tricarboxylate transporter receptor subunit TctC
MGLKRLKLAAIAAATAVGLFAHVDASEAQSDYPNKPITIIVPRSAGGGIDQLARLLAPVWEKELGGHFVIENTEGAGGAIAIAEAEREPADGYTILCWSPPAEYVLQLQGRFGSGSISDWQMIGATNSDPGAVAVPPDSPFKTFNDILAASKGGKRLSVATIGRTTGSALSAMVYQSTFGVKWGIVPFDGGGDMTTALIGGHTDFGIRQGGMYDLHPAKLRIVAVAADQRIAELPDVPTIKEATGKDIVYSAFRGFAIKKGTPPEIVKKLQETFNKAAQSPEIANKQFEVTGFRYQFLDAAQFQKEADNQAKVAEQYKDEILGK